MSIIRTILDVQCDKLFNVMGTENICVIIDEGTITELKNKGWYIHLESKVCLCPKHARELKDLL